MTYTSLHFVITDDTDMNEGNMFTEHGSKMEPIIHEGYDLLTGNITRDSGFWTIQHDDNPLKGMTKSDLHKIICRHFLFKTKHCHYTVLSLKIPVGKTY